MPSDIDPRDFNTLVHSARALRKSKMLRIVRILLLRGMMTSLKMSERCGEMFRKPKTLLGCRTRRLD